MAKKQNTISISGKRNSIPIKHITHGVDYGGSCINKIESALIDLNGCADTLRDIQKGNKSIISKTDIENRYSKKD